MPPPVDVLSVGGRGSDQGSLFRRGGRLGLSVGEVLPGGPLVRRGSRGVVVSLPPTPVPRPQRRRPQVGPVSATIGTIQTLSNF